MTQADYDRITAQARMTSAEYDQMLKVEVQCHTIEGWQHARACRNHMEADAYIQRMPQALWARYRVVELPADKWIDTNA
jgi:hypothetical protein